MNALSELEGCLTYTTLGSLESTAHTAEHLGDRHVILLFVRLVRFCNGHHRRFFEVHMAAISHSLPFEGSILVSLHCTHGVPIRQLVCNSGGRHLLCTRLAQDASRLVLKPTLEVTREGSLQRHLWA